MGYYIMKNFYNNFLTEYKGLQSEVSDTISEEINLNLKGGENSLFPNFIKNKSDNISFLRQEGNELFLNVNTTQNLNLEKNKDSTEFEYFVSNITISEENK